VPEKVVPPPVTAKGYQAETRNWWAPPDTENEQTPELRWPASIPIYDAMRRQDSQVRSVLRAVVLPVQRTNWWIDPNGARDEVVQLVSEDLNLPIKGQDPKPRGRTRDRFSWWEHLRLALLMLPFGHSFFEQKARIDSQGRARLQKLEHRPARTIAAFNVAADGGLESIEQHGHLDTSGPVTIEISRLVGYVYEREGGNWAGMSLLRPAYKNWLLKDRLLRVQTGTIERNGLGIPVYEGAEGEKDLSAGLAMAREVRSGEDAGAATPNGAKLRLMGVEGELPDALPVVRYHDEQIARAVLAHFLNLGTQTGSWALGSTFADFFTLSLQALAQQIADVATQHVVEDIVDWNWGTPDNPEPAPRIVFDEIGSQQMATAQAIKFLIDAGVVFPDRSLEEAVRQQYGLPPKDTPPPTPPAPDGGTP
jgi:hypothetical protein